MAAIRSALSCAALLGLLTSPGQAASRPCADAGFLRLADRLAAADPARLAPLQTELVEKIQSRSRELLPRVGGSFDAGLACLVRLLLVDPSRFTSEESFRRRVAPVLRQGPAAETPAETRGLLLFALEQTPGFDFELSEEVESAWGAIARPSRARHRALDTLVPLDPGDQEGTISGSIYSLPSTYFSAQEAAAFLRELRRIAPERPLLALVDLPMKSRLEPLLAGAGVELVNTFSRRYSPWPRDPMIFLRAGDGGLVMLLRPNRQPGREEDSFLGRELLQGLPERLDRAWGGTWWSESPVPFHQGQMLLAGGTTWISLHTLEERVLALLELDEVPAASFDEPRTVERYLEAARRAAGELETLLGQPVRWVHPLPAGETAADLRLEMEVLGGGAGYDLDSLVALLPAPGGGTAALVADLEAGRELVDGAAEGSLAAFAGAYQLEPSPAELREVLSAAQTETPAQRLGLFLDRVAHHLDGEGLPVRRLPLLLVPTALIRNRGRYDDPRFVVTWTNVVAERAGGGCRAEGFASLLPAGDRQAVRAFDDLGCELRLLPPLPESVRRGGGYRCASNHVRPPRPALAASSRR